MPSEMTTIDRARVRRLEEAFAFLASLHRRGVGVDIRRGRPIMAGDSPAVGGEDVRALDHLAEPLKEILSGQRKDWARDRREIVLAADPRGDGAGLLAALDLVERRFIANPLLARLDDAEALGRLAARLRDAQAVVAATTAWTERALIGRILAELEIGRGKMPIIEVDAAKATDYRYFLAGSAWVDMRVRTEGDPSAQALLGAMQVRSLRQDALREVKQGLYTASAVRELRRDGLPPQDIAARLRIPAELVERWLGERSPDEPHGAQGSHAPVVAHPARPVSQPRPPSLKQIKFVEDVMRDFAFLSEHLPGDWKTDGEVASNFLSRVRPHLSAWRVEVRRIQRARALRQAVGEGLSLADACARSGAVASEVIPLLAEPPDHMAEALRNSAGAVFSEPAPAETPVS